MAVARIRPNKIKLDQLLAFKDKPIEPMFGLNIPNTTDGPEFLMGSMPIKESIKDIIRGYINSITPANIDTVVSKVRNEIKQTTNSDEMIQMVAAEILESFLVSFKDTNKASYMKLLNNVARFCVEEEQPIPIKKDSEKNPVLKSTASQSKNPVNPVNRAVGSYFINLCKDTIFESISPKTVRYFAELDLRDKEKAEEYNCGKARVNALILILCELYAQRKKNLLKLSASQLCPLLNIIVTTYITHHAKLKDISDPKEISIQNGMLTIYAELILRFLELQLNDFSKDGTQCLIDCNDAKKGTFTFQNVLNTVKVQIAPTLTLGHLKARFATLKF